MIGMSIDEPRIGLLNLLVADTSVPQSEKYGLFTHLVVGTAAARFRKRHHSDALHIGLPCHFRLQLRRFFVQKPANY
jgi:hypothetical protein